MIINLIENYFNVKKREYKELILYRAKKSMTFENLVKVFLMTKASSYTRFISLIIKNILF